MADYKRIIKNVLFIALVPSVFVGGYYGYKAYKKYKNKDEEIDGEDENGEIKDKDETVEGKEDKKSSVEGEIVQERKEVFGKVIPITRVSEEEKEVKETKELKKA